MYRIVHIQYFIPTIIIRSYTHIVLRYGMFHGHFAVIFFEITLEKLGFFSIFQMKQITAGHVETVAIIFFARSVVLSCS